MPSSACSRSHPHLHSLPTRRSSDLPNVLHRHRRPPRRLPRDGQAGRHLHLRYRRPAAGRNQPRRRPPQRSRARRSYHHQRGRTLRSRSEEHTSELQSLTNLVCRLLLARAHTLTSTLSLHDALPICPMFFIDIAVPRDVSPEMAKLDGIFTYDIDDLQQAVTSHVADRRKEAERAEAIITSEVERFEADRKSTRLNSSH